MFDATRLALGSVGMWSCRNIFYFGLCLVGDAGQSLACRGGLVGWARLGWSVDRIERVGQTRAVSLACSGLTTTSPPTPPSPPPPRSETLLKLVFLSLPSPSSQHPPTVLPNDTRSLASIPRSPSPPSSVQCLSTNLTNPPSLPPFDTSTLPIFLIDPLQPPHLLHPGSPTLPPLPLPPLPPACLPPLPPPPPGTRPRSSLGRCTTLSCSIFSSRASPRSRSVSISFLLLLS